MSVICIIPARGGSKGIKNKNIIDVLGCPLIEYSIKQALNSKYIDEVYVTTDSLEIAKVSASAGAKVVMRPAVLSDDLATSESAILHCLEDVESTGVNVTLVVFLQCTSPIRYQGDLDDAIAAYRDQKCDSLLSVVENHRFIWERSNDGTYQSVNYDYNYRQRRQDLAPQFCENGSIYIFTPAGIRETGNRLSGRIGIYVMRDETAYEIDGLVDVSVIEALLPTIKCTVNN